MQSRLFRSIALDCVVGFACLSVLTITAVALHRITYLTLFMLFGAALFFSAGLLTADSNKNPWLQGIALSIGASIPVIVAASMVFAALASPLLWGFVILVALVCGAGAQTRKLWRGRHRIAGAFVLLALIALIITTAKVIVPRLSAISDERVMDKPAPDIAFAMLDGTPVSLPSLKGRVIVLDFWGTWCTPCVAELPELSRVYQRFQGNRDVVFLAVNSGWNDDTPEKIRAFAEKEHLSIPVAIDTTGAARKLGITSLPSLLLIDKHGHIRMEDTGYDNPEQIQKFAGQIENLLRAK